MRTAVKDAFARSRVTYTRMFWLFMLSSFAGVLLEGLFCLFRYGHWETHVVSLWGPFCIIYGIGAVGCYMGHALLGQKKKWVQFMAYSFVGFFVELICGSALEYGLSMRAWDYSQHYMNIHGHVSMQMTMAWGFIGIVFSQLAPWLDEMLSLLENRTMDMACTALSVFMAVDLFMTAAAVGRWSRRHFEIPASGGMDLWIDENYPDEFMEKRFCEWRFLGDEPEEASL